MKHLVQKKIEIETDITRSQTGIVSVAMLNSMTC